MQAIDQAKRYDGLSNQCKAVSGPGDLGNFMRVLPLPPITTRVPRRAFAPPGGTGDGDEAPDFNVIQSQSDHSSANQQRLNGSRVADELAADDKNKNYLLY